MDYLMMTFLAAEFMQQTGLDIMNDRRAYAKVLPKCTKCRELLTATQKVDVCVDSVMHGRDLR